MIDAKDILLKALRQYRHNCGDDKFVAGYELGETQKIVQELLDQRNDLVSAMQEVITISDRTHDAWDKAKSVMAEISGEQHD